MSIMFKSNYPRLYIGVNTIRIFKNNMRKKYPYIPVNMITKDNLAELLDYYTLQQSTPYPLILEDLYYQPQSIQTDLLKFIEDSPLRIVLLSSYDNIIPALLSRMSLIYKDPNCEEIIRSEFLNPSDGRMSIYSKDKSEEDNDEECIEEYDDTEHQSEIMKRIIQYSPMVYYHNGLVNHQVGKSKLLQLLESDYVPCE